jgi:hypothetical protein
MPNFCYKQLDEMKKERTKAESKIKIGIVEAAMEDFTFYANGKRFKKIGLSYILRNQKGGLEVYQLQGNENGAELAIFVREGRCFLFEHQAPGEGRMIEELLVT